jgi:hypothetical protein
LRAAVAPFDLLHPDPPFSGGTNTSTERFPSFGQGVKAIRATPAEFFQKLKRFGKEDLAR